MALGFYSVGAKNIVTLFQLEEAEKDFTTNMAQNTKHAFRIMECKVLKAMDV
jgi:hypothetical protein